MQIDAVSARDQTSVARIAGALAHELNNPLQGVLSLVSVALRENRLDQHSQGRLEQIHHGVSRLSRAVASLSVIYENLPRPPDFIPLTKLLSHLSDELKEQGFRVDVQAHRPERTVYCFCPELVRLAGDLLREYAPERSAVHFRTFENGSHAGIQCRVGGELGNPEPEEWSTVGELVGVSGLPILVDEIVRLADGKAEFDWSDSNLIALRLWMRSA